MKRGGYSTPNLDDPNEIVLVQCWCRAGYVGQTVSEWERRVPPICERPGCGPWGKQ